VNGRNQGVVTSSTRSVFYSKSATGGVALTGNFCEVCCVRKYLGGYKKEASIREMGGVINHSPPSGVEEEGAEEYIPSNTDRRRVSDRTGTAKGGEPIKRKTRWVEKKKRGRAKRQMRENGLGEKESKGGSGGGGS